jgi:hypothetical protein
MKRNYIPKGHTYAPSEIAERNEHIDALCARIQPYALAAFESAVMRQTTEESAAELAEEARAALLEVLADPGDVLLDEETVRLKEALAAALKQEPKTLRKSSDAAWMARRGADLARAVVGFWVDLGEEATARYKTSISLLDDMAGPQRSGLKRRFELIYSRFRLDANEAGGLLNRLNAAVLIGKLP